MSTARTFTPLIGAGLPGGAIINNGKFGYQDAEQVRQALDMALYLAGHLDLGGSDDVGVISSSYLPVVGYRDFTLDGDAMGGLTVEAVVYTRTSNVATTATARIRNTSSSTTVATSAGNALTTVVREVLTVTPISGPAYYRLELSASDAVNPVHAWGYMRIRKVPA